MNQVATREKKENRYEVFNRKAPVGITRKAQFGWTHIEIERDVKKIMTSGGRHVFFTKMLSPEKAASFHRAICSRARKLIGYNNDGTKRWRTERNKEAQTITLFVKKAV
jgi:hypothetical protein